MRRTVISSKGRVTIPAELRKKLGLSPGTHINWTKENGKLVLSRRGTRGVKGVAPTTNDQRPPPPP